MICGYIPFGITSSMWEKIIPVVISTGVVVLLFVIGRILDSYIKSKEVRRNWYQKVIIEPNISKVEAFYKDFLAQARLSVNLLAQSHDLPQREYFLVKLKEIEKFKVIKRGFEYEFLLMVQTNYPEITSDLASHLCRIEDCVTICLDRPDLSIGDFDSLETDIVSEKYCIYGILYKPLIYTEVSLRQIISRLITRLSNFL